ncbi:MAG TPA: hypothetical protein VGP47_02780 [Parachlamydiaceae bacterium]|nr:hypothetical protein [Parachlamydiaceae bacterium]
MSSISALTFTPQKLEYVDISAKITDCNVIINLPQSATDSNNNSPSFKDRFFETIASVKKLTNRFLSTIKIAERADFFPQSDSKSDLLKVISIATLPFILLELCLKIKNVYEVVFDIPVKDTLSEKITAVSSLVLGFGNKVYEVASSAVKFISSALKTSSSASNAIKTSAIANIDILKILKVALLPFILIDTCTKIYKIYKVVINESIILVKDKLNRIGDISLCIVSNCVDITTIIAGLITHATLATATGFLSAINIVIQTKKLYDSIQFYRRISNQNFSISQENKYDFQKNLDPSVKVKCILRMDKDKEKEIVLQEIKKTLRKRYMGIQLLDNIEEMDSQKINQLAKDIFKKIAAKKIETIQSVRNATKLRSIQKILCLGLKGLASAINIAATAILLAAPPLAPASYGLLGISALISLTVFIIDKYVAREWEKTIVTVVKRIIDMEWKAQRNPSPA